MDLKRLCYYIRIKNIGGFGWMPYMQEGIIPVFLEMDLAKEKQSKIFMYGSMIMPVSFPPHKESPLYKKKCVLVDSSA